VDERDRLLQASRDEAAQLALWARRLEEELRVARTQLAHCADEFSRPSR
jgi:hypothetical protein